MLNFITEFYNLHKHFARIQNAVRVKDFFDGFHNFERRRVHGDVEILAFDVTDVVLTGKLSVSLSTVANGDNINRFR